LREEIKWRCFTQKNSDKEVNPDVARGLGPCQKTTIYFNIGVKEQKMLKPAKVSLDLGIVVSDINASLKFYQNLLGLEFLGKISLWFGTLYRLTFGGSDLKLIEPYPIPPRGPIGLESQLGLRYVTFVIQNLSELCQKLKTEGIEFTVPEQEILPGVRIAMVKDPDGNIVEFLERA